MRPFELTAPATLEAALGSPGTFLAGGTTLVDLMKLNVLTPRQVLDINELPLRGIDTADGLRIGALERMSDIADHPGVYPAISGANRMHAVLGTSQMCVATHASDVAVALVALDAEVRLASAAGSRTVKLADFYRPPGDTPEVENDLRPGELITEVLVPRLDW